MIFKQQKNEAGLSLADREGRVKRLQIEAKKTPPHQRGKYLT